MISIHAQQNPFGIRSDEMFAAQPHPTRERRQRNLVYAPIKIQTVIHAVIHAVPTI